MRTEEIDRLIDEMAKTAKALEDMTPEALGGHIRDLILDARKARRNRNAKRAIRKGDLRALCQWEREITENYGVERRVKDIVEADKERKR